MLPSNKVKNYVERRIGALESMRDPGRQKALYAQLRRGVGTCPGEIPQLWGLLFDGLPEDMMSRNGEPTREEWAIGTALTLYAFHQQGRDPNQDSMHQQRRGIGQALAGLVETEEDRERVQRRFSCFATASDMSEAVVHLRGMVSLLRNEGIGLDYARLAGELYGFQSYEGAKRVRLSWGQDFYRAMSNENKEEK